MPEFRKDPIVDRWVIIAKERAGRPQELEPAPRVHRSGPCPFCAGNEAQTTPEVLAFREPGSSANTPGWRVRVVPNRFPALQLDGAPDPRRDGIYDSLCGVGVHEVIIESPDHLLSSADLPVDHLREVLLAYRERLIAAKLDPRLRYGMVFKNTGAAAGASIEHVHSQFMAMPLAPTKIREELDALLAFHRAHGRCLICDIVAHELACRERIVLDTPAFVAFCPFASSFPFETCIVTKEHGSRFESLTDSGAGELAGVLKEVIGRIEAVLHRPAYNYMIHTAPFDTQDVGHYHWRIEVTPRLTNIAGFEWGTGFNINPAPPEEAAEFLRSAKVDFTRSQIVPIKESR
jgi:UDPglucose--hexose-1-phosphate uridylyltransferase